MKTSRRARRMARHHRRHARSGTLNLVSLIDIFTILVFFLLVSSAPTTPLPHSARVELPPSSASSPPAPEHPIIEVGQNELRLQGRHIMAIGAATVTDGTEGLERLRDSLAALPRAGEGQRRLTIMGDGRIPYRLLQEILSVSQQTGFTGIDLAILHRPRQGGD